MELYKIIATINNNSQSFPFDYLPENFEGVKISQSFSFNNPIGYTPKFSIDTMRVILNDKTLLDTAFTNYGLQSDVIIEVKSLDSDGINYSHLAYFAIDFESYEIFDVYSEFALKSISNYDKYVSKKNTEKAYTIGTDSVVLPNTLTYTNYVSLKSAGNRNQGVFVLEKNNESKIYDGDTALYNPNELISDLTAYWFEQGFPIGNYSVNISAYGNLRFTGLNGNVQIVLLHHTSELPVILYEFFNGAVVAAGTNVSIDLKNVNIPLEAAPGDFFTLNAMGSIGATITGDLFFDLKKKTFLPILQDANNSIGYIKTIDIVNDIFDNNVETANGWYIDRALTSANHLAKNSNIVTLKPSDFVADFAKMLGLIVNSKIDGKVQIEPMSYYFEELFSIGNAITITDYKDLYVKYKSDLSFNSVSVGKDSNEYEVYPYFIDWNKVLTFTQQDRYGNDDLDLTLQKFRTDFAGIIDYFVMRSNLNDKNRKDNFIFNKTFADINPSNVEDPVYDHFTPRDILVNWETFLSFCFQNFNLDTLTLSSNGGTNDNLTVGGVSQFDDYQIEVTTRLIPIEYTFTCAIGLIDYSENIIKINNNNEDVYLFVINAETTDRITEQKITGLKIQF